MAGNPFLSRTRGIGVSGREAERKSAKRLGARLTPNSGAMTGAKGDMSLGDFLIEAKSTVADSVGLKLDWLAKISGEAAATGRKPALSVTFTRPDGTPVRHGKWVLVPETVFAELTADKDS